jgi:tetratricopeptide (TPR) repeat protein/predicted Ser/Thr protein kinase
VDHPAADDLPGELPDELADRAGVDLLAVHGSERTERLRALIAAHPRHSAALQQLAIDLGGAEGLLGSVRRSADPTALTNIGGHRVIRLIGEGAFGAVYLCAQERPIARHVAIKVLRPGVGDAKTLARFAAERQLLASLNHASITQVFDAGELADGRPFLVMEYADGLPLQRYCEERALACRERLQLFVAACEGVAHAHHRGIVHRDLKPANVLVVDTDSGPLPKIIDFGIAKLVGTSVLDMPLTDAGRVIGTPGYMSPEQAAGRVDEIDARADVWALGVMLYQLLTGELPWGRGASSTDTDPVLPSRRITTAKAPATAGSERRQIAANLRGDLDWITMKALAKGRDDRYPTVAALAADIERHLAGEPVSVGPPTLTYRLRKFVRRHRAPVLVVAGAALVAAISLGVALARGRSAEAHFATATAAVGQLLARANDATVREAPRGDATRDAMLRDALKLYDGFLQERPDDPALRASRCRTLLGLTHVHWLLGDTQRAIEIAVEAVQQAESLYASAPGDLPQRGLLGEALCRHAIALTQANQHAAAHQTFTTAAEHLTACAAADPRRFGALHASALRGQATSRPDHATAPRLAGLRACVQALDALRDLAPPIPRLGYDAVLTRCILGEELTSANLTAEAETVLAEADAELPQLVEDRFELSHRVNTLRAKVAFARGERASTLAHWQAALAAATDWIEQQPLRLHPRVMQLAAQRQLGYAQNYAGQFDASVASYRQAITRAEALAERYATEPVRQLQLVEVLFEFALTLFDRFRRGVLEEAAGYAARATAIQASLPPHLQHGRQPRWQLLGLEAQIAAARGADGDRLWALVEANLPADPQPSGGQIDTLLGIHNGLARWHVERGRQDAASACIGRAEALVARHPINTQKRVVEMACLATRLAVARGELGMAAEAADRIVAARPSWYGRRHAADCLHLAWRVARDDPANAATASAYAERAQDLYRAAQAALRANVQRDPKDPWFVVPWGIAGVRTAELTMATGDRTAAATLLAEVLPILAAVRADCPADLWDEDAIRDGNALQSELASPR